MTDMNSMYRGFRNPGRVVGEMLLSGNPAAYTALAMAALRYVAVPLDRVFNRSEQAVLAAAGLPSQPLGLIVGGSRTGSTVLYQILSSTLVTSYFPNFSAAFPRSPLTATRRLMREWKRSRGIKTYFGQTSGPAGPSDGFHVWNRWLGSDRFEASPTLTSNQREEMNRFFGAWTRAFPIPFVNKNNRNLTCIPQLAQALPSSRFIVIRRSVYFSAQSLLLAREKIQGDPRFGWGVLGEDMSQVGGTDQVVPSVANQIFSVEERLREGLATVPRSRILELSYEDLCADTTGVVNKVAEFLTATRTSIPVPKLANGNVVRLDAHTKAHLDDELAALLPDYQAVQ